MTVSRVLRHSSYPVVGKAIDPLAGGTLGDTACSITIKVHIIKPFLGQAVPLLQLGYCLLRVQKIS